MFIGFCKYTTVHVERLREVEIGPCRHESHYDDPQTSIYFCEGGVGGSMSVYVDVWPCVWTRCVHQECDLFGGQVIHFVFSTYLLFRGLSSPTSGVSPPVRATVQGSFTLHQLPRRKVPPDRNVGPFPLSFTPKFPGGIVSQYRVRKSTNVTFLTLFVVTLIKFRSLLSSSE